MHRNMTTKQKNRKRSREAALPAKYRDSVVNTLGVSSLKANCTQAEIKRLQESELKLHSFFSTKKTRTSEDAEDVMHRVGIHDMDPKDYIGTAFDRPDLVEVREVNLLRSFGGKGLFATQDIPAGTCIGLYTGKIYTREEFKIYCEGDHVDLSYTMHINDIVIDGIKKGNFTRFINFSDNQDNVKFSDPSLDGNKVVTVVTKVDIKKGQQLLVDYNTYDEQASKHYLFINPGDNHLSTAELARQFHKNYSAYTSPVTLPAIQLQAGNRLHVTQLAAHVLNDKKLTDKRLKLEAVEVDLPCLHVGKNHMIAEFDQSDVFTPLMAACSLGQLENVQWLVQHHANINQQQHQSGNCPLFIALEGYAAAPADRKQKYFDILLYLITHHANLAVHDRNDKTLLHKAIRILTDDDFKVLVNQYKIMNETLLLDLYQYIDDQHQDIVMTCLRQNQLEKFKYLLTHNPEYFDEYYAAGCENIKANFRQATKAYSKSEKAKLAKVLTHKAYNVSQNLLNELDLIPKVTLTRRRVR